MRKTILLCLLSFIISSSYAQSRNECIYHIKFYKWEWDYCKCTWYDTLPSVSPITGHKISDTIIAHSNYQVFNHSDLTTPRLDLFVNSPVLKYDYTIGEVTNGFVYVPDSSNEVKKRKQPTIKVPLPDSFAKSPQELIVESYDGTRKYKVEMIWVIFESAEARVISITGAIINEKELKQLNTYHLPYYFGLQFKIKSIDESFNCPSILVTK